MVSESEVITKRSFCRVCTALCGILVDTQGEQVLRVRGDPDHPASRGYTCTKGRALPKMHHHPQRLERPLMRKDGVLQPASWDDCLDDLCARLRAIIDEHGPAAIGIYFGSGIGLDAAGYRMAEKLHAAIGTPARFSPLTIDGTAKVLVAGLVGGFPGLNLRPDYDRVKLLLYIGINPVISHGHATSMPLPPPTAIRAVAERGEVWVIDPRCTETARFATGHIAPHPGKDYAILAYLVRELLQGGCDENVLAHSAVDSMALRAAVAPYTAAQAADIAGVLPSELSTLLAAVRNAGRLAIETGTGVTMSAAANVTQWLAWVLMIITDSMNRPGGVWFHPGFLNQWDGGPLPVLPPELLFAPGPQSRAELSGFLGEWPCAALQDEIRAGNIRAFLNLGGNLVTAFPDENALRPALQQLDVLLSLDIIHNETTALSTHVLPTSDQLERPDVTLWDTLSACVSAQYSAGVVKPVGERRATWWVLAELIRRLGYEVPAGLPDTDGREQADAAMLAATMVNARCSFDELAQHGYFESSHELPATWIEKHIENLGGWRLAPVQLLDQLAALGAQGPQWPSSLRLVPRRQKRHLNAQLLYLGDTAEVMMNPADAVAAGVAEGQRITVSSNRGAIIATARLDSAVRPGVVSMPHGYEDANVNRLTDTRAADALTGMAVYSGIPVRVRPAN